MDKPTMFELHQAEPSVGPDQQALEAMLTRMSAQ
jgi:hypothetical protein